MLHSRTWITQYHNIKPFRMLLQQEMADGHGSGTGARYTCKTSVMKKSAQRDANTVHWL